MGHTDQIAVGDCGLPIPEETERIDLALKFGVPGFMEVLCEVKKEMKIEKIILAEEIKIKNPKILEQILQLFDRAEEECEIEYVSHAVSYTHLDVYKRQKPGRNIHLKNFFPWVFP